MRTHIFTERERRLLEEWLETGEETGETLKVFTWIRRNFPHLGKDLDLMFKVIRELRRQRRWKGRITGRSELGSLLRRAESALTRIGRGRGTSAASKS